MTNRELELFCAILTTIAELGTEAREGPMFAALCGRMSATEFTGMLNVMARADLIARGPSFAVAITEKGRQLAATINAAVGAAR